MKKYGTIANVPRHGHPPKPTGRARRALIREAAKRPTVTLEELQRSTTQLGESVHRTTVSHALHKLGLCLDRPANTGEGITSIAKTEVSKQKTSIREGSQFSKKCPMQFKTQIMISSVLFWVKHLICLYFFLTASMPLNTWADRMSPFPRQRIPYFATANALISACCDSQAASTLWRLKAKRAV